MDNTTTTTPAAEEIAEQTPSEGFGKMYFFRQSSKI